MILIGSTWSARSEVASIAEPRRQRHAGSRRGLSVALDHAAGQHRVLVQQLHRVAEQHLGVEFLLAVGGEQVVQVERQRRVRQRARRRRRATAGRRCASPGSASTWYRKRLSWLFSSALVAGMRSGGSAVHGDVRPIADRSWFARPSLSRSLRTAVTAAMASGPPSSAPPRAGADSRSSDRGSPAGVAARRGAGGARAPRCARW